MRINYTIKCASLQYTNHRYIDIHTEETIKKHR